ncbi:predicted protein [Chaetomium globosum CBS 148.51]|uniref:Uncharacterized protein n=1 Tax=Chaetomium globosum (strain ATCC 6205 / CBS 148.51 / DSM 1962 / NBRC 6347 / NRRL 1970) TaxID=306901 RepID=Q2H7C1_CHAGB|nr:uncharacterized protein CHGG_05444 [Chaetomium globosum CBS 148.51]EAQ88825.1 predicted protein [Chaetomium globosum CBS 148.51]
MPPGNPDLDLERGLMEGNKGPARLKALVASNERDTSVGPPEERPPPAKCATPPDLRPGTPIPPPSTHPNYARSAYSSQPVNPVPHHHRSPRAFPSRPTRPVRRSRRAPSTSSSRASSNTPGSPRRRSLSSTNRPVEGRTTPSNGPPPSEKFPAAAVNGYGSVALHPRDAENQGKWAVEHHHAGLVHEIVGARKQSKQKLKRLLGITEPAAPGQRIFRVSFAEMQRLKLQKLQVKLVDHAIDMFASKQQSPGWEEDPARYTQALKDYDYMLEARKLPQDYFYATKKRAVDRYVIRRLVGDLDSLGDQTDKVAPVERWDDENMTIGGDSQ